MDITLERTAPGICHLIWPGNRARCAIGEGGIKADKHEGDGATPAGAWPLREVFYRPDRLTAPTTGLPVRPLTPEMGWCDDPRDPAYNRPVTLPYAASHEALWRDDAIYDLIVPLGYNDETPQPGRGSAIFLHVARPDYSGTAGCLALARGDVLALLGDARPGDRVVIA